jgi:hypothetical protein
MLAVIIAPDFLMRPDISGRIGFLQLYDAIIRAG